MFDIQLLKGSAIFVVPTSHWASQVALAVKNPSANARNIGDRGSIPESGRFPEGGHGNLVQYSCLENSVDRGAW